MLKEPNNRLVEELYRQRRRYEIVQSQERGAMLTFLFRTKGIIMSMTTTIQTLPKELNFSILSKLACKDFVNAMKVCKTWKQIIGNRCFLSGIEYDKSAGNLVIDIPRDLVIDKALSVAGALLIRATNIYSKPGICLSGNKVTLVANQIRYLGPINAPQFESYTNDIRVKGPMSASSSSSTTLAYVSDLPDFWPSLVNNHHLMKD